MTSRIARLTALALLAFAPACAENELADPAASEAPLSDLDALLEGSPDNSKLPDEAKADQIFPAKWTDLVELQSPVKSQGSRGVCSIFSTAALMEHLYIKEGTLPNPDFSEQFLQWSVKFELKRFTKTGGSNAGANIDAIRKFGIVLESDEPYQSRGWSTADDEACTGDDRPTRCYTNGEPSERAMNADRWRLPTNRWVSSRRQNIKAFMTQNKTAVVAGMQFFYQSWNHRRSELPTNSTYWSEGYVLYPNAEDKEASSGDKRAGHSILIVGWDDDLEVPVVDKDGNTVTDEEGNPVTEKGFWLFKNSWGTSGFGIRHEAGAGYGWLSMRYVEEFGSVNGSAEPKLNLKERCDDGKDNNFDGVVDCDDPACGSEAVCRAPVTSFESGEVVTIPDNDLQGVSQSIAVATEGFVTDLRLTVDIEHTFLADLRATLTSPSGKVVTLFADQNNNVPDTFNIREMVAESLAGDWTLTIVDAASKDEGTLNGWTLNFEFSTEEPVEVCDDGLDNTGNGNIDCADAACASESFCANNDGPWQGVSNTPVEIPDNDPAGATSTLNIEGVGAISAMTVLVDITHSYVGDLTLSLTHPDGTQVVLRREEGGSGSAISDLYTVTDFNGKSVAGEWTLKVVDAYDSDVGTINNWLLEVEGF